MTRNQAFGLLVFGILAITAALTWRFGWIGLLCPGAFVFLWAIGVDQKDEPPKEVTRIE
jgi:hypothetical protein